MSAITATTTASEARPGRAPAPPVTIHPILDSVARHAWADYVTRAPAGTLFHHPDWCECVAAAFRHQPLHLLARRGGATVGVLPLLGVRSLLAGELLVSVPYGTYGGILAEDAEARAGLAAAAVRLTHARGARLLELRSAVGGLAGWVDDRRYVVFTRRLPSRVEELETYLPRKARAAARQARRREGLTVRHDAGLLRLTWGLYARSMRRLGSLNYPYRFFEKLVETLGPRAWVTVVWKGARPVAGLLSFVFRDRVYPYFVGVDERRRCTGATNLLYLSVMERAVGEGLRWFDFGRSRRDNVGAFDFKRNQGFEPQPLGYQRYVPPGATLPDLSPGNPRYARLRRVWTRLPLALTRPLGAWLSASIPG